MGSDQSAGPESNEVARRLFEEAEHVHENSAGHSHEEHGHSKAGTAALALGALGVVYGDIGTSPLYALKEAFTEKSHIMTVDRINVYGICSLAFWALVIIISIKFNNEFVFSSIKSYVVAVFFNYNTIFWFHSFEYFKNFII